MEDKKGEGDLRVNFIEEWRKTRQEKTSGRSKNVGEIQGE
jgi:hypothetical protein